LGFGTDHPAQVGTHLRNIQSDSRELFIVTINGVWCDAGSGCDSIAKSFMLLSECKSYFLKERIARFTYATVTSSLALLINANRELSENQKRSSHLKYSIRAVIWIKLGGQQRKQPATSKVVTYEQKPSKQCHLISNADYAASKF